MSEAENILQTVFDKMTIGEAENLILHQPGDKPMVGVWSVPENTKTVDLTNEMDKLATKLQPWRRTGTAKMFDLQSLIIWANRHKGDTSALFAEISHTPSLTCIADYQAEGPAVMDATSRDPKASHNRHRATYAFPVSAEWKLWTGRSGKPMGKAELGEFVEANAKDMLDPSDMLVQGQMIHMEPWEKDMWRIAAQVKGRFGNPGTLIDLSRRFEVDEKSTLSTTRNPDTGESSFQFINEHQNPDGTPVKIPNLFLIAVPVFENGALYRLAVRFRYAKAGSDINFTLTLHNPDLALRDAVELALAQAVEETALPLMRGTPEA